MHRAANNSHSLQLLDDEVIVDYSILGRAVLQNDSYSMPLIDMWEQCRNETTLWQALGLASDPDYQMSKLLQINEVYVYSDCINCSYIIVDILVLSKDQIK